MSLLADRPNPTPSPLVFVQWVDSSRADGWSTAAEIRSTAKDEEELRCWSVGFLLADEPDRIVIASTENANPGALSPLAIPRVAIHSIKRLAEVELKW